MHKPILTRSLLFLLFLFVLGMPSNRIIAQTTPILHTHWILDYVEEIETGDQYVGIKDYHLNFGEEFISYNLMVNGCKSRYELMEEAKIKIESPTCTRKCCDEDISDIITYDGVYFIDIQEDRLIITTDSFYCVYSGF